MDFVKGKEKFIHSFGTLGSDWGINRTMAQIYALLLISPEALSADEIMSELKISRGNANMNIRALIDWGLVYKELKTGERKEFFIGEKDMGQAIKQIIIHRKKKELEPMLKVLDDVAKVENKDKESAEFLKVVQDMKLFSHKANTMLDKLVNTDNDWLMNTFLKLIQ